MREHADRASDPGLLLWLLAAVVLLTAGCASHWTVVGDIPAEPLLWPPPPQETRVRYAGTIRGFAETGSSLSSLVRRAVFGKSSAEPVRTPVAVAVDDSDGRIAVADAGCRCVHLYLPREKRYHRISRAGSDDFGAPVSLAFGPHHLLYVSDSLRRTVSLFDAEARFVASLTAAGTEPFQRPTGVAWSGPAETLFVVDTLAHRIHAFDSRGRHRFSFGSRGTAAGNFNFPTHIAASASGTLYVTDAMNFRVQLFDGRGRFLKAFGRHGDGSGDFAMPKGIAATGDGIVYVVDSLFDAVQAFTEDGVFLITLGGRGAGPGEFWLPSGAYLDGLRTLYVCDTYNQRIQLFSLEDTKP